MNSVVCTLFEGHYHLGVAALVNSIYTQGFRGTVYAGYKGKLPVWATDLKPSTFLDEKAFVKEVVEGLQIVFVSLQTDYHLTNYKPDFMLDIWQHHKQQIRGIFYFDPDIVLVQNWSIMEDWIQCGVAVSEDVNSPLHEFNPRRCAWRSYFGKYNIDLRFKNSIYVNGGFTGVSKMDIDFLEVWKQIQETMAIEIGGLNRSAFVKSDQLAKKNIGDFAPFSRTDQDALNAALEVYTKKISYGGKEVMAFANGLHILPHALGKKKPWMIMPVRDWLKGKNVRVVDKAFLQASMSPIPLYSSLQYKKLMFSVGVVTFLSRFYSK